MASAATVNKMGRASYIWIKHEEERREASWKEPEGRVFSTTTRTDVAALLGEPRDQILAGRASFADLAAHHSGCWGLKRFDMPLVCVGRNSSSRSVLVDLTTLMPEKN
uniref:peptidylprolyl isomerase n=1 Tax=Aegilops tauschii TaxID=37682 RepID=M8BV67_AEGTA